MEFIGSIPSDIETHCLASWCTKLKLLKWDTTNYIHCVINSRTNILKWLALELWLIETKELVELRTKIVSNMQQKLDYKDDLEEYDKTLAIKSKSKEEKIAWLLMEVLIYTQWWKDADYINDSLDDIKMYADQIDNQRILDFVNKLYL